MKKRPNCPDCKISMYLKYSQKFNRLFYGCFNFPMCKNTHGANPEGGAIGIPANKKTRRLRQEIHKLAEQIWRWDVKKEKKQMYKWLRKNNRKGHIGKMNIPELLEIKQKINKLIKYQNSLL